MQAIYLRNAGESGDGRPTSITGRLSEAPGLLLSRANIRRPGVAIEVEMRRGRRGPWTLFRVEVLAATSVFVSTRCTKLDVEVPR